VEAIQGWNWIYNHSSHSCSGNSTRPIPPVICAKKTCVAFIWSLILRSGDLSN
jgi:hypothetical protein